MPAVARDFKVPGMPARAFFIPVVEQNNNTQDSDGALPSTTAEEGWDYRVVSTQILQRREQLA